MPTDARAVAQDCATLRDHFGELTAVQVLLSTGKPGDYVLADQMVHMAADMRAADAAVSFAMRLEPVLALTDDVAPFFAEPIIPPCPC